MNTSLINGDDNSRYCDGDIDYNTDNNIVIENLINKW